MAGGPGANDAVMLAQRIKGEHVVKRRHAVHLAHGDMQMAGDINQQALRKIAKSFLGRVQHF